MKKTLSTLALSLFALVGVAQAADITVENAAGKQVVPQNPQRVIVLDFGAAIFQNLQTKNIRMSVI